MGWSFTRVSRLLQIYSEVFDKYFWKYIYPLQDAGSVCELYLQYSLTTLPLIYRSQQNPLFLVPTITHKIVPNFFKIHPVLSAMSNMLRVNMDPWTSIHFKKSTSWTNATDNNTLPATSWGNLYMYIHVFVQIYKSKLNHCAWYWSNKESLS